MDAVVCHKSAAWKNAVLHARISLGGTELSGADIPPDRFKPMRSAYLTLSLSSDAEADRIYDLLRDGGQWYVLEVEATEPSLWLDLAPPAATARFADAVMAQLEG